MIRLLSQEEVNAINFNEFTVEDIYCMIDMHMVFEQDVAEFFGTTQWEGMYEPN